MCLVQINLHAVLLWSSGQGEHNKAKEHGAACALLLLMIQLAAIGARGVVCRPLGKAMRVRLVAASMAAPTLLSLSQSLVTDAALSAVSSVLIAFNGAGRWCPAVACTIDRPALSQELLSFIAALNPWLKSVVRRVGDHHRLNDSADAADRMMPIGCVGKIAQPHFLDRFHRTIRH